MRSVQEILRSVKERFSKPTFHTLVFGPVSVKVDLGRKWEGLFRVPVYDTARNLESARENGIRPLSLAEVLSQINGKTDNLVLFDTNPVVGPGNHWRVLHLDQEKRIGTLQLCGTFGTYDYQQVPPVEVPFDAVMFTGISFHPKYTISGTPAKLADVVRVIQESCQQGRDYPNEVDIDHEADSIYFSDAKGTLRLKGNRLINRE